MTNLGYRAPYPQSYPKIERIFRTTRQILAPGTPWSAPFPALDVADNLDRLCIVFPGRDPIGLELAVHDARSNAPYEGLSYFDAEDERFVVGITSITYEQLLMGVPRAKFTLCHEISHVVLHSTLMIRRALLSREELAALNREVPNHPKYFDTEWQANAGAAALLMPALGLEELRSTLGGRLLMTDVINQFQVSCEAGQIRSELFESRGGELVAAAKLP